MKNQENACSRSLHWQLLALARTVAAAQEQALETHALDLRRYITLLRLAASPCGNQLRLAQESAIDKSTLVSVLDGLEAAGLISRSPDPQDRRAKVIAVDPAKLRPEILAKKGVTHIQESAFTFQPDVTVDWLFCDMAWRPLEAAALLAKWGRRRWTRMLVANIKLPMTKKAEILTRIRAILEHEGDYKHVKMKQLYHDRDEITVTAHVS